MNDSPFSDLNKTKLISDAALSRLVTRSCDDFCRMLDEYVDELDLDDVESIAAARVALDRIAPKIESVKKRLIAVKTQ